MFRDAAVPLAVVAVLLVAMALGYYVGSSGPWRQYASAMEEIVKVREAQLAQTRKQIEDQVAPAFQELNGKLQDAKRLLRNLLDATETGMGEARQQAEDRLTEWAKE